MNIQLTIVGITRQTRKVRFESHCNFLLLDRGVAMHLTNSFVVCSCSSVVVLTTSFRSIISNISKYKPPINLSVVSLCHIKQSTQIYHIPFPRPSTVRIVVSPLTWQPGFIRPLDFQVSWPGYWVQSSVTS